MNATAYFLMAALAYTLKLAFALDRRDARQRRALHNIARALALPPAKLRADDAIDFLQNQHWSMNDRLLAQLDY